MEQRSRYVGLICLIVGVAFAFGVLANPFYVGVVSGKPQTLYRYNKWTGATWIAGKALITTKETGLEQFERKRSGADAPPLKIEYKWIRVNENQGPEL